jgi:hypothetical protein
MNRISQSLVLIGIAVTAPVWAVSVPENSNAQPAESAAAPSNQYIAANMTTGSATLVPLMAVEMEANHAAAVDAPAGGGGGQSDDDIAFVRAGHGKCAQGNPVGARRCCSCRTRN